MTQQQIVDCHVHMVGNGSGGSGCELNIKGPRRLMARIMCKEMGLPQSAISENLEEQYVSRLLDMTTKSSVSAIVLLALDYVRDEKGKVIEGAHAAYVPNELVLKYANDHAEILAGVSIHPARPDAMEELEKCIAGGAVAMKCLPNCQNIELSNKRYKKFWERMAQAGIVLIAHTGGEYSLPSYNKNIFPPDNLQLPLDCGVTVIAAHCATSSNFWEANYVDAFAEMTERYVNLYGDNSGLLCPLRAQHLRKVRELSFRGRIVHGSDVPVQISGLWPFLQGMLKWKDYRKWRSCDNLIERDFQLKKAMGFSEETFTRFAGLINQRE